MNSGPAGHSRISFLLEFARHPMTVGAVTPSSAALAHAITTPIPHTGDPIVVELGAGTGAFTRVIQRLLDGRGHHIAVESNEQFARRLAARFPGVDVVAVSAQHLPDVLARRGHLPADVIVSGLPWAAFPPAKQRDVLAAVVGSLSREGAFTTFAYAHLRWAAPARRLRRSLEASFEEVVVGRTIWANLPPAFVYHCRRPTEISSPPLT
ncbi:class I SAM-dependent methyltransferase [Nonomuraea endophytica]|uniref:Phospholipid N-methyltransferase n=1 Tax=Nonomuraea endophytica TaxID=714136 RepID=A0A7W8AE55_9ACTN|nr:SAM-dependent methyltransferase [Nonomuraea endophytica]MBB5083540.1 phospholipid N-methyltransferase [Nonomuraea endophytica]